MCTFILQCVCLCACMCRFMHASVCMHAANKSLTGNKYASIPFQAMSCVLFCPGTLHHHAVVRDILDKKKGAIIIIDGQ